MKKEGREGAHFFLFGLFAVACQAAVTFPLARILCSPPFPTLRVPPLLWLRRRRRWRRAPSSCPPYSPPRAALTRCLFEAVPWRIFAHYSSAVEGCLFSPGLPSLYPPLFPLPCRQNRHLPFLLLLLLAVRLLRLLFVSLPFPPPPSFLPCHHANTKGQIARACKVSFFGFPSETQVGESISREAPSPHLCRKCFFLP